MNINGYLISVIFILNCIAAKAVFAIEDCDDQFSIPLVSTNSMDNEPVKGCARLKNRRNKPDSLLLHVEGLQPLTDFTVFLTHSPQTGSLPAQFLGEFRTNLAGNSTFRARTEIFNAFASSNLAGANCQGDGFTDDNGVANSSDAGLCDLPGARINQATTVSLDWFRVYQAVATDSFVNAVGGSVFGGHADELAGGHILTSTRPVPEVEVPGRRSVCDRRIEELQFRDENLAQCIRQLSLVKRLICPADLTRLSCNRRSISDLTGLEMLTNLQYLHVHSNQISDLNPLANLQQLKVINLNNNAVNDVSALQSSSQNIEVLRLRNQHEQSLKHIEALRFLDLETLRFLDLRNNHGVPCSELSYLEKFFQGSKLRRSSICQAPIEDGLQPPFDGPIISSN